MANIEEIKAANPIEAVVQEAGHDLVGRGRYLRSAKHDSLVVDTHLQAFFWNSAGKQGDVITWVMDWKRVDFKGAVEVLARRAVMPDPEWTQRDAAQRLAFRAREDALTVACRHFVHRLWRDDAALAYVRGRGWTDETIKAAGLGFTGENSAENNMVLSSAFTASGVDLMTPGAVAVIGFEGAVAAWLDQQKILEFPQEWVTAKRLPPIWKNMLVYPHVVGGRVGYISLRAVGDKKHANLQSALVGPRQPYFNHVYGPREEAVVVVEGQADAVTLAQWGIPAVALAGVSAGEELLRQLRGHKYLYVALDKDKAGQTGAGVLARTIGPLARLVEWPAHDANDWLKEMNAAGVAAEDQAGNAQAVLDQSKPLVLLLAEAAGRAKGAKREEAVKTVMEVIAAMDEGSQALYRGQLPKAMGLSLGDFKHLVKQASKELDGKANGDEENGEQEIVGGYVKGWLIELMYKPEEDKTSFAYRDPDGKIGVAAQLEIEGVVYKAKAPNDLIRQQVVVLPSAIGPEIGEKELVAKIVELIHRHYLIDPFYEKLAAYYVLFTWAFDSFRNLVYLRMLGEMGSGKTQLMQIIGYCCRRLMVLSGVASDAALFRTMHLYKGTLYIDEADKEYSDTDSQWVKIMNTGDRRGFPVVRMRDTGNTGLYDGEAFDVFGPKLLTTRKRFDDDALESRCLTIETIKHSTGELIGRKIPIHLTSKFFEEAAALRNELLHWRLRNWQAEVEVDPELVDEMVQARLNQVMMPILQIVKDPEVRKDIRDLVRRYQSRMTTEKSMTLEAKVLQAIIQIHEMPPVTKGAEGKPVTPYFDLSIGNIAKVANAIMDEENADPDAIETGEDASARGGKKLTPKGVGSIVNKRLNLVSDHATAGPLKRKYVLRWDEERIAGLRSEYGV